MKRNLLILVWVVFGMLFFSTQGLGECPEEPNDPGECDTVYVEKYPGDEALYLPPPWLVRFPIYVTHDLVDLAEDSIAGFVIPLCYTFTNPSEYCSLSPHWNNTNLYPQSDLEGSIFRHFIEGQDTVIHNWMMDLSQKPYPHGPGIECWDTKILELASDSTWVYWNEGADSMLVPPHFWLALAASAKPDRKMEDGSRILIATMTFKVEGSWSCEELTIDTCWWPPSSRLQFGSGVRPAYTYIPRQLLPITRGIGIPGGSLDCPFPESRHTNGTFQSEGKFRAYVDDCGVVSWVYVDYPLPPGISDAQVVFTTPPGSRYADGHVVYTVADHCQHGGDIWLWLANNVVNGPVAWCDFEVFLSNNPPRLNLPESVFTLVDQTVELEISVSDLDSDSLEIVWDGFWHEPDSLQPPTNPPFYDGGNPGLLTWLPTQADSGFWICSFSATDVCGAVHTHRVTIFVGTLVCGDCIEDTLIDLGDLLYLLNYVYKGGPSPVPPCRGDVNCDAVVDLGDMLHLISYLYKSGPAPCFVCCAGVPARTYSRPDLTH